MVASPLTSVQILTSLPNIQISHFADLEMLYADWISFQTGDSIQHGCELVLQQLRQGQCSRLLNDNTRLNGPWDAAIPWLVQNFFPRAAQAGLERMAWILSPSLFSQFSAQKTVALLPPEASLQLELFRSFDEAYRWLVQR